MAEYGNEYEAEWDSNSDPENWETKNDGRSETEIEIENTYYEAESVMKTKQQEALEKFEAVIMLEENTNKVVFGFLAVKNVVILSMQLGLNKNMIDKLRYMLKMSNKVSKNDLTEAVNLVQDAIKTTLVNNPD